MSFPYGLLHKVCEYSTRKKFWNSAQGFRNWIENLHHVKPSPKSFISVKQQNRDVYLMRTSFGWEVYEFTVE